MEIVEEANRAFLKSCNEFLDVMSLPRDEVQLRNAMVKGSDALLKAKRFSSLLRVRGHARFRQSDKIRNQSCVETSLMNVAELGSSSKNVTFQHNPKAERGSSSKSLVYQGSSSKPKPPLHQQKLKYQHQPHLFGSLNFDSSSTIASSILSVDNSVSNMNSDRRQSHDLQTTMSSGSNGNTRKKITRSIVVPAISDKVADIPPDRYSWRKYGQKPIKNADHPRGYYRCSVTEGCPAKKIVERCTDDPSQLRVTYINDHDHHHPRPSHAYTV